MTQKSEYMASSLQAITKNRLLRYMDTFPVDNHVRLPSERELCEKMDVSRVTLRSALDELLAEGRIFRKHGSGTYINPAFNELKASLYPAQILQEAIRSSGYTPSTRYLGAHIMEAGKEVASALKISSKAEVVISRILFYADGHFCIWCNDYYNKQLVKEKDLLSHWSYESAIFQILFDNTGRSISWDFLRLSVTDNLRTPALSQYMDEPDKTVKPFLVTRTINYDKENRPLLYSVSYVNTDYVEYGLIRKKQVDQNKLATHITK